MSSDPPRVTCDELVNRVSVYNDWNLIKHVIYKLKTPRELFHHDDISNIINNLNISPSLPFSHDMNWEVPLNDDYARLPRVVVTGTAGTGKTTLIHQLIKNILILSVQSYSSSQNTHQSIPSFTFHPPFTHRIPLSTEYILVPTSPPITSSMYPTLPPSSSKPSSPPPTPGSTSVPESPTTGPGPSLPQWVELVLSSPSTAALLPPLLPILLPPRPQPAASVTDLCPTPPLSPHIPFLSSHTHSHATPSLLWPAPCPTHTATRPHKDTGSHPHTSFTSNDHTTVFPPHTSLSTLLPHAHAAPPTSALRALLPSPAWWGRWARWRLLVCRLSTHHRISRSLPPLTYRLTRTSPPAFSCCQPTTPCFPFPQPPPPRPGRSRPSHHIPEILHTSRYYSPSSVRRSRTAPSPLQASSPLTRRFAPPPPSPPPPVIFPLSSLRTFIPTAALPSLSHLLDSEFPATALPTLKSPKNCHAELFLIPDPTPTAPIPAPYCRLGMKILPVLDKTDTPPSPTVSDVDNTHSRGEGQDHFPPHPHVLSPRPHPCTLDIHRQQPSSLNTHAHTHTPESTPRTQTQISTTSPTALVKVRSVFLHRLLRGIRVYVPVPLPPSTNTGEDSVSHHTTQTHSAHSTHGSPSTPHSPQHPAGDLNITTLLRSCLPFALIDTPPICDPSALPNPPAAPISSADVLVLVVRPSTLSPSAPLPIPEAQALAGCLAAGGGLGLGCITPCSPLPPIPSIHSSRLCSIPPPRPHGHPPYFPQSPTTGPPPSPLRTSPSHLRPVPTGPLISQTAPPSLPPLPNAPIHHPSATTTDVHRHPQRPTRTTSLPLSPSHPPSSRSYPHKRSPSQPLYNTQDHTTLYPEHYHYPSTSAVPLPPPGCCGRCSIPCALPQSCPCPTSPTPHTPLPLPVPSNRSVRPISRCGCRVPNVVLVVNPNSEDSSPPPHSPRSPSTHSLTSNNQYTPPSVSPNIHEDGYTNQDPLHSTHVIPFLLQGLGWILLSAGVSGSPTHLTPVIPPSSNLYPHTTDVPTSDSPALTSNASRSPSTTHTTTHISSPYLPCTCFIPHISILPFEPSTSHTPARPPHSYSRGPLTPNSNANISHTPITDTVHAILLRVYESVRRSSSAVLTRFLRLSIIGALAAHRLAFPRALTSHQINPSQVDQQKRTHTHTSLRPSSLHDLSTSQYQPGHTTSSSVSSQRTRTRAHTTSSDSVCSSSPVATGTRSGHSYPPWSWTTGTHTLADTDMARRLRTLQCVLHSHIPIALPPSLCCNSSIISDGFVDSAHTPPLSCPSLDLSSTSPNASRPTSIPPPPLPPTGAIILAATVAQALQIDATALATMALAVAEAVPTLCAHRAAAAAISLRSDVVRAAIRGTFTILHSIFNDPNRPSQSARSNTHTSLDAHHSHDDIDASLLSFRLRLLSKEDIPFAEVALAAAADVVISLCHTQIRAVAHAAATAVAAAAGSAVCELLRPIVHVLAPPRCGPQCVWGAPLPPLPSVLGLPTPTHGSCGCRISRVLTSHSIPVSSSHSRLPNAPTIASPVVPVHVKHVYDTLHFLSTSSTSSSDDSSSTSLTCPAAHALLSAVSALPTLRTTIEAISHLTAVPQTPSTTSPTHNPNSTSTVSQKPAPSHPHIPDANPTPYLFRQAAAVAAALASTWEAFAALTGRASQSLSTSLWDTHLQPPVASHTHSSSTSVTGSPPIPPPLARVPSSPLTPILLDPDLPRHCAWDLTPRIPIPAPPPPLWPAGMVPPTECLSYLTDLLYPHHHTSPYHLTSAPYSLTQPHAQADGVGPSPLLPESPSNAEGRKSSVIRQPATDPNPSTPEPAGRSLSHPRPGISPIDVSSLPLGSSAPLPRTNPLCMIATSHSLPAFTHSAANSSQVQSPPLACSASLPKENFRPGPSHQNSHPTYTFTNIRWSVTWPNHAPPGSPSHPCPCHTPNGCASTLPCWRAAAHTACLNETPLVAAIADYASQCFGHITAAILEKSLSQIQTQTTQPQAPRPTSTHTGHPPPLSSKSRRTSHSKSQALPIGPTPTPTPSQPPSSTSLLPHSSSGTPIPLPSSLIHGASAAFSVFDSLGSAGRALSQVASLALPQRLLPTLSNQSQITPALPSSKPFLHSSSANTQTPPDSASSLPTPLPSPQGPARLQWMDIWPCHDITPPPPTIPTPIHILFPSSHQLPDHMSTLPVHPQISNTPCSIPPSLLPIPSSLCPTSPLQKSASDPPDRRSRIRLSPPNLHTLKPLGPLGVRVRLRSEICAVWTAVSLFAEATRHVAESIWPKPALPIAIHLSTNSPFSSLESCNSSSPTHDTQPHKHPPILIHGLLPSFPSPRSSISSTCSKHRDSNHFSQNTSRHRSRTSSTLSPLSSRFHSKLSRPYSHPHPYQTPCRHPPSPSPHTYPSLQTVSHLPTFLSLPPLGFPIWVLSNAITLAKQNPVPDQKLHSNTMAQASPIPSAISLGAQTALSDTPPTTLLCQHSSSHHSVTLPIPFLPTDIPSSSLQTLTQLFTTASPTASSPVHPFLSAIITVATHITMSTRPSPQSILQTTSRPSLGSLLSSTSIPAPISYLFQTAFALHHLGTPCTRSIPLSLSHSSPLHVPHDSLCPSLRYAQPLLHLPCLMVVDSGTQSQSHPTSPPPLPNSEHDHQHPSPPAPVGSSKPSLFTPHYITAIGRSTTRTTVLSLILASHLCPLHSTPTSQAFSQSTLPCPTLPPPLLPALSLTPPTLATCVPDWTKPFRRRAQVAATLTATLTPDTFAHAAYSIHNPIRAQDHCPHDTHQYSLFSCAGLDPAPGSWLIPALALWLGESQDLDLSQAPPCSHPELLPCPYTSSAAPSLDPITQPSHSQIGSELLKVATTHSESVCNSLGLAPQSPHDSKTQHGTAHISPLATVPQDAPRPVPLHLVRSSLLRELLRSAALLAAAVADPQQVSVYRPPFHSIHQAPHYLHSTTLPYRHSISDPYLSLSNLPPLPLPHIPEDLLSGLREAVTHDDLAQLPNTTALLARLTALFVCEIRAMRKVLSQLVRIWERAASFVYEWHQTPDPEPHAQPQASLPSCWWRRVAFTPPTCPDTSLQAPHQLLIRATTARTILVGGWPLHWLVGTAAQYTSALAISVLETHGVTLPPAHLLVVKHFAVSGGGGLVSSRLRRWLLRGTIGTTPPCISAVIARNLRPHRVPPPLSACPNAVHMPTPRHTDTADSSWWPPDTSQTPQAHRPSLSPVAFDTPLLLPQSHNHQYSSLTWHPAILSAVHSPEFLSARDTVSAALSAGPGSVPGGLIAISAAYLVDVPRALPDPTRPAMDDLWPVLALLFASLDPAAILEFLGSVSLWEVSDALSQSRGLAFLVGLSLFAPT